MRQIRQDPRETGHPAPAQAPSAYPLLARYFRSGWVFLTPYVAVYVIYAAMRWPVNGGVLSLLHVYWVFHGIHLSLWGFLIVSWIRRPIAGRNGRGPLRNAGFNMVPWFLLGCIFLIPGIAFEFPTDNWAHLTRLLDFSRHTVLTQTHTWAKSSYFMGYSLVTVPTRIEPTFLMLNAWYVGCCLLLAWQYYRLARSIGLSVKAAHVAVLLHVLLLGNNVFGFHRYYALSSALFAQVCALALIRSGCELLHKTPVRPRWGQAALIGGSLLALIVFNHIQGAAIGCIGLMGIIAGNLIQKQRLVLLSILFSGFLVINGLAFLWIADAAATYTAAWLTPWRGFNLFSPASPAFGRSAEILGALGLVNLLAGVVLIRRNHVAGWLTLMPLIILALPIGSAPFLLRGGEDGEGIGVFHRLLLGIPAGLALVVLATSWHHTIPAGRITRHFVFRNGAFATLLFILVALTTVPPGKGAYNRLWHVLVRPPADLSMEPVTTDEYLKHLSRIPSDEAPLYYSSPGLGYVASIMGVRKSIFQQRWMTYPNVEPPSLRLKKLQQSVIGSLPTGQPLVLQVPSYRALTTPYSCAAVLSGHWLPAQVALEYAGGAETEGLALAAGSQRTGTYVADYYPFNYSRAE